MAERIAIIDALRSPVAKANGALKSMQADTLGAIVVSELIKRVGIETKLYDEVIIGNVAQPAHASNIARVIALRAGFSKGTLAYTVHRNCASGMQSFSSAAEKIYAGKGEVYMVGGVESMSNIPLLYNKAMTSLFTKLFYSKSVKDKLYTLSTFRPSFLKPVIGLMSGLTDPVAGMIMGKTAEILAKEFGISRDMQDEYALHSHLKAESAITNGIFKEEILPIPTHWKKGTVMLDDDGVRFNQNLQALSKLRPIFERHGGTVTAGNSSQVSDGAAAAVVMRESKAKELGLKPLGFIRDYAYAGLEPHRMGLGPTYATKKVLLQTNLQLSDFDLIELNEAFAAQVLANIRAFDSESFAKENFEDGKKLGELNEDILNVNGGAIALGHPVGMSGTRIMLHALKELHRRKKERALATLCIGGGQGAAFVLEVQ